MPKQKDKQTWEARVDHSREAKWVAMCEAWKLSHAATSVRMQPERRP